MTIREYVGDCFVDAGIIWIGDPCYIMGDDASNRVTNWFDFCDKISGQGLGASEPLGPGVGICTSTAYGDGAYPVHITYKDGRPIRLEINLEGPYEEWADEEGWKP